MVQNFIEDTTYCLYCPTTDMTINSATADGRVGLIINFTLSTPPGASPTAQQLHDDFLAQLDDYNSCMYAPERMVSTQLNPGYTPPANNQTASVRSGGTWTWSSNPADINAPKILLIVLVGIAVLLVVGFVLYRKCRDGGHSKARSNMASATAPVRMQQDVQMGTVGTSPWSKMLDANTNAFYYFNSQTNESRWDKPQGFDAV